MKSRTLPASSTRFRSGRSSFSFACRCFSLAYAGVHRLTRWLVLREGCEGSGEWWEGSKGEGKRKNWCGVLCELQRQVSGQLRAGGEEEGKSGLEHASAGTHACTHIAHTQRM